MMQPDLPQKATPYCQKVTIIWVCFFIINGGIACYTALYSTLKVWALYNSLISYCLMGALFFGEFLYRKFYLKTN
jgi:uncharacterized membrane protein